MDCTPERSKAPCEALHPTHEQAAPSAAQPMSDPHGWQRWQATLECEAGLVPQSRNRIYLDSVAQQIGRTVVPDPAAAMCEVGDDH
jgi:hypothetical protein